MKTPAGEEYGKFACKDCFSRAFESRAGGSTQFGQGATRGGPDGFDKGACHRACRTAVADATGMEVEFVSGIRRVCQHAELADRRGPGTVMRGPDCPRAR